MLTGTVATRSSVLVDTKDPYAVHACQLGDDKNNDHRRIDPQRLAPEVGAVAGKQVQNYWHSCEEFPGRCELMSIVYLFPECLAAGGEVVCERSVGCLRVLSIGELPFLDVPVV